MKIFLSETIYYDTISNKIYEGLEEKTLSKKRAPFLKLLLEQKGKYVSKSRVLAACYPDELGDYYTIKNINSLKYQLLKDLAKWGLPKDIIEYDNLSDQYRIKIYDIQEETSSNELISNNDIQDKYYLTKLVWANATTETVIGREQELREVLDYFHSQRHNRSLLIHGFGGVGKTSFARLLLAYLQDEYKYDYIAVLDYHKNIINSMVEAIELEDFSGEYLTEKDSEKKWLYISKHLKNSNKKKLFIIDNVDADYENNQNPLEENEKRILSELTGWRNTDVIITSRIPDISNAFYNFHLGNLGDVRKSENCIRLFFHYNRNLEMTDENIHVVKKIIKKASYNTMVIELLARSSINVGTIEYFYECIDEIGFEYSDIEVSTMHDWQRGTAKSQLMRLFEMKKRTKLERMIVWDFHTLPEGTNITREEFTQWLGYRISEAESLINEGWIKVYDNMYSIHPLVKQAMVSDFEERKKYWQLRSELFANRQDSFVKLLTKGKFLNDSDGFGVGIKKLKFIDAITYHGEFLTEDIIINVADYARKLGLRALSVSWYKVAYERLKMRGDDFFRHTNKVVMLWKATYYYGYMLSYTKSGMREAERLLRESLDITEFFYKKRRFVDKYLVYIAASMDHLGYVLSNLGRNDIKTFSEADFYLRYAAIIRRALLQIYDNAQYLHDYAWSIDNLGCLYANIIVENFTHVETGDYISLPEIIKEKNMCSTYLKEALKYRRMFAEVRGNPDSTEVAWTCCNLANLLNNLNIELDDAEKLLEEALSIYHRLNQRYPSQPLISDEARACTVYARLLRKVPNKQECARKYYEKALELNRMLEEEHPGVYDIEIKNITKEMREMR